MTIETAEARGAVMVRPWRVGLLIDTHSPTEVREAIMNLSSVWGGRSMPIFDKSIATTELESLGEMFGVDSLYADITEGPLAEFLRMPGWAWQGRGRWGPFGNEDDTFRKGLLPIRELLDPSSKLVLPGWSADNPADLAFAAMWGLPDKVGIACDTLPYMDLLLDRLLCAAEPGVLASTMLHINADSLGGGGIHNGVYILRSDHPEDIVNYWNARALGGNVIGIPSAGTPELINLLVSQPLPSHKVGTKSDDNNQEELYVFGGDNASPELAEVIEGVARSTDRQVRFLSPEFTSPSVRIGLETEFNRTVRVEFRPASHGIDVDLPRLPLVTKLGRPFGRGIVAAEVRLREVRGQDPRFTAFIPPYRRHADLIRHRQVRQTVDHARSGYEGMIFGLDASDEDLHVPFAYNQDVIRLLFDSAPATVKQSDVGKFQTRAAEKFGGPYNVTFNQPGVRAAVTLAAGKPAGVPLPHLRSEVEKERGGWPHSVMDHNSSPRDYAIRAVNHLFHSGLFVPTLKVHCSHCRVESHVTADGLGPTMNCEFCGQAYNLALSHSLSQPEWRYRLAAHLRADQVEALLPALATTSLLQRLRHSEEPPPLVLGFEITLEGRKIEADIAAYFGDREWLAVLGEVKTGNRIDSKDVANLEFLRTRLQAKDVRCLLLFATLKNTLSPEERRDLRGLVERSTLIRTSYGQSCPNFPLVLTGPDLSRNYWDEEHPWRWEKNGQNGIFDTALVSCERNLGLIDFTHNTSSNGAVFTFNWAE